MVHPSTNVRHAVGALLALVLAGCASPSTSPASRDSAATGPAVAAPKTLTVLMNDEPKRLGPIGPGGGSLQSSSSTPLLYEGFLTVIDGSGNIVPRLALEIPTIESGDWRVLPDGDMETTWKLRPGAVWHDGTPFTARDFVFTWQVWQDPQIQITRDVLTDYVDRAEAVDDTTLLLHWKSTFGFVHEVGIHPLVPRHILETSFQGDKDQFNNHRWNTVEYVGLGPYRLKEWVPGGYQTFEAFDRYVLGKPKIQTIIARFVLDANVLATVLLAGQAEMNIPWGATADAVSPVQRRWQETGEGKVLIYPGPSLRFITYQSRDEYQRLPALKQIPVRQALLYALDTSALVDLLYNDRSLLADAWYVVGDPQRIPFADAITRYTYEPRRASQLLEQQGWRPGTDGALVNAAAERFATSLTSTNEAGQAVAAISSYWRQLGIAVEEDALSPAQTQDRELRAKFPGMEYSAHVPVRSFLKGRIPINQIPGPENRWSGSNRNGLTVPELDNLMRQFDAAIEPAQRTAIERDMARQITGEAQIGFLFMYPHQWMVRNSVTGIIPSQIASTVNDWPKVTWNVHEWDLRAS